MLYLRTVYSRYRKCSFNIQLKKISKTLVLTLIVRVMTLISINVSITNIIIYNFSYLLYSIQIGLLGPMIV
jgi:hypothetical protein